MPVEDSQPRKSSFTDRARSVLSNIQQDEHVKQATEATKDAVTRTEEASRTFSGKVTQADSWEALRGDVEELTEIARAHHALIIDLIDRIESLEARPGSESGPRHGG
jgi:hypothetical protein